MKKVVNQTITLENTAEKKNKSSGKPFFFSSKITCLHSPATLQEEPVFFFGKDVDNNKNYSACLLCNCYVLLLDST